MMMMYSTGTSIKLRVEGLGSDCFVQTDMLKWEYTSHIKKKNRLSDIVISYLYFWTCNISYWMNELELILK